MKKITSFFALVLTLLMLAIPNVAYAEMLVVNKDAAIYDGLDIFSFEVASEASAIFKYGNITLSSGTDAIIHIKATIPKYSQPYFIMGGIMIAGQGYSKADALEKLPTLEIITWTDECIEYKILIRFDDSTNNVSKRYGIISAIKKLPDNIEAAYINCKLDVEAFKLSDLTNPASAGYNLYLSKIVDKRNVYSDASIAKIEDGVVGPYTKYVNFVEAGDELSVKVVLDRPYGVLNSGKVSLTGVIPDGFSYVPGSAGYKNSAGYANANSIDETTGTPILTINNMPVGEYTVFTFRIKANENLKNKEVELKLENIFQKEIVVSAGMKKFDSSWYPNGAYSEDEYIKNDKCYINVSYSIEYDSNGGNGEVVDENDHECLTENGAPAIILGGSDLSKKNYKFIGWNTMSDGTGKFYYKGDEILLTENTKLFAVWKPVGFTKPTESTEPAEPVEALTEVNPNTGASIMSPTVLRSVSLICLLGAGYCFSKKRMK